VWEQEVVPALALAVVLQVLGPELPWRAVEALAPKRDNWR
jgi:hypothetical protein